MVRYYAGIGSRETPQEMRKTITRIAGCLSDLGYTLRSGGADGADSFFEEGCTGAKEIYLPWPKFNGNGSERSNPSPEAFELARSWIKGFDYRSQGAQKLLARNMHQVLGYDLKTPVDFVVCWTLDGKITGGTAHAIRLAMSRDISVYNLAEPLLVRTFLNYLEKGHDQIRLLDELSQMTQDMGLYEELDEKKG